MGMKTKVVHASRQGTKRPLCEKRQGKVSSDPAAVTCVACGRTALRLVEAAAKEAAEKHATSLHGRQEAALASAQPPRWWEGKTDG